jgi:hypothetical protein
MRLWTILMEVAWKRLNESGYLICDDEALVTKVIIVRLSLDDAADERTYWPTAGRGPFSAMCWCNLNIS